jgi:predicted NAD/FAD-dependent oxidoreductase
MAPPSSTFETDVLVVGAGIGGLLAAKTLSAAGHRVIVFDKGRGLGGRLATRRIDDAVFDHGAQYFTARDPGFRALVQGWLESGIVRPWATGFALSDGTFKEDGEQRYCGVSGMTGMAKHLAQGLDVRLQAKVDHVAVERGGWKISTEKGGAVTGRALLLTSPVPQSLQLLAAGKIDLPRDIRTGLEQVEYAPCLALLVQLSGPSAVPDPGGLWLPGEPISWIADNQRKGISPGRGVSLTIHAGPAYSLKNWATPEAEVTQHLLEAAAPWLGGIPRQTQLHRWRYSIPTRLHPDRCVSLDEPAPLVLAGDAFGGPRIEGAALSGWAAAARLAEILTRPDQAIG